MNGFRNSILATSNGNLDHIQGLEGVAKADEDVDGLLGVLDGRFGGDLNEGSDEVVKVEEGFESWKERGKTK